MSNFISGSTYCNNEELFYHKKNIFGVKNIHQGLQMSCNLVSSKFSNDKVDTSPFEEMRLLTSINEGRIEAFWNLWKIHKDMIFQICFRRLGYSQVETEDVCSAVMEKSFKVILYKKVKIKNFKAWLIRIAINSCIDFQRRNINSLKGFLTYQKIREEKNDVSFAAQIVYSPERQLLTKEITYTVRKLILKLPPRLQLTLQLYLLEDYSFLEISKALKISYPNVRKRIQEARTKLKKILEPVRYQVYDHCEDKVDNDFCN